MPNERGSKRKAPVLDSISAPKKPLKKKAKTSAVDSPATSVSSPVLSSSISKSQRQRRPQQQNATPGPSNDRTPQARAFASVSSTRRRLCTPDGVHSDWSPPPVSSLKSGRVPKPTAKSLASATPGLLSTSKKSRKLSSKKHERTPTVTTDAIELFSTEDENEPKRKRPQPPSRRKTLVMTSSDVIDLCSDDDRCRTAKSSPVRTRLENDITVILSSEDESQLPPRSQPKSGRPARLKKLTLKAQALLSGTRAKKASRDDLRSLDETRATSPGQENVRSESNKSKRRRLGNAASQSSAASQHRSGSASDIEIVIAPITDQTIGEDGGDEGDELQQVILVQHNSEVNDTPLADLPSEIGDDRDEGRDVPHDADLRAAQEEPQAPPTSDVVSPEYPCAPAPISVHLTTGASDLGISFSEQNAQAESSGPHNQSELELHQSLDSTRENEVHTMQDAILLPSIRKESSVDEVEEYLHPVENSSCVGANDLVVPSEELQNDFVSGTINKDHHVESTTNATARPSPPPPTNVDTEGDKGAQDALAQDGGGTSELEPLDSDIPLETHTTSFLPDDVASEEMNLQDVLLAKQQEPVLEDSPPDALILTAGNSSSSSPGVPSASCSKTINPDGTSPHLPPHLPYAPPPFSDMYRNHGSVSPAPIKDFVVEVFEVERDASRESAFATGVAEGESLPAENEESGPSEFNTEFVLLSEHSPMSVSAEWQSIYNESGDVQDVQMQKALLQLLSSNEGSTEDRAANENRDEHGSTGQAEEESSMPSDPDPDPPHLSATPPLKYDGPVEEVISKASVIPASPLVSCDTSSTKPSNPFSGLPSFPNENIAPSYTAAKRNLLITYSSCPPAVPPRLLTAGFFSRSFLQPTCVSQPRNTLGDGSAVAVEGPPQSEPQHLELLREWSSTPPVMRCISPQYNEDDNPETIDGLPAWVVAQPSPTVFSESPCETAEEAEVDLQLTHVETDSENVPMPAAAVTETTLLSETFKDVQERATRSPCADSSEHEHSDRQAQPQAENGSRQVLSLGSADAEQSSVESGEHHDDPPAHPCSASEQRDIQVKSLSKSSFDSLETIEDSPAPTTPPVQLEGFDTSSFFIRSASPIDFGHDILKDLVDHLAPLPLDKDDDIDAYLLTHSFEYPEDVDAAV